MSQQEPWHISHSIQPALIFAAIVQIVALVWFAAQIDASVSYLSQQVTEHIESPRHDEQEESNRNIENRVLRLELIVENQVEILREQAQTLKDIKDILSGGRNNP